MRMQAGTVAWVRMQAGTAAWTRMQAGTAAWAWTQVGTVVRVRTQGQRRGLANQDIVTINIISHVTLHSPELLYGQMHNNRIKKKFKKNGSSRL